MYPLFLILAISSTALLSGTTTLETTDDFGTDVIVRTSTHTDAEQYLTFLQDNAAVLEPYKPLPSRELWTLSYVQEQLTQWEQEYEHGTAVHFFICKKDAPDTIVGYCNFTHIKAEHPKTCYLDFDLAFNERGGGIMRAALKTCLDYMFNTCNVLRIIAPYMPEHINYGKLLHKVGFVNEGYAPHYQCINGTWRDYTLTALNKIHYDEHSKA
jgi:ribosomal-protein-alanine N-acetyltransferase